MTIPVYYKQIDSTSGQSGRMCFSSCGAMVVATYRRDAGKPEFSQNPNWDDEYLKRVNVYGDSTEANAQVQAMKYYGYDAKMYFDMSFESMIDWLKDGNLAPCGMLHHGPADRPEGGGHYVLPFAIDSTHVTVHDPYGEQDVVNGGFVPGKSGKGVRYSRMNFGKRWMVPAGCTGWALLVQRP